MDAAVLARPAESRAIADFLASAAVGAAGLMIEGDAGIGKTTLWFTAIESARRQGFHVLSSRAAAAESVMAYAALADLLDAVDDSVWEHLPTPQRHAVDRVLLHSSPDGLATDRRAVAAAVVSILRQLTKKSPVLVAIDDVHWLDPSSKQAIAFAARRLPGRVGLLGTVRTESDADTAAWLELSPPDVIQRLRVPPLSLAGLHAVVANRLGRALSRPAMARIQTISGGNPFYALELARAMESAPDSAELGLPKTLAELVHARIGGLHRDAHEILLAAACLAAPTVDLVALATNSPADRVMERLEEAEVQGIVRIEGNVVRFAHPLLATGVYTDAAPPRRRAMHRRMAAIVQQSELQARHLALAATTGDPRTLRALDEASESARIRGAPAAAAELLDLAVGLGGDTPRRRMRSANHHLDAGDAVRARSMLEDVIAKAPPGAVRAEALNLLAVVRLSDDSFSDAAVTLESALAEADDDLTLRAQTLVMLAFALVNAGDIAVAVRRAEEAVQCADELGPSHLLSQALSMRTLLGCMYGTGLDEASLRRAVELEDPEANTPVPFRPSMHDAMLLSWAGQLDLAHERITAVRQRCTEHGGESELMYIAMHRFLLHIWRADLHEAALVAEDAMERARQLAGDVALSVALTIRGALAVFEGRADDARRDIGEAFEGVLRGGSYRLAGWLLTTLGFLEESLGNHETAVKIYEPLLTRLAAAPDGTEIIVASFVPDAVEAMVALGRLSEAETLIDLLERNGRRLDRAWMLATGARGRALLLAAGGDLAAGQRAAEQAMVEHERLPMPFERARTQLVLGQIQRRRRLKHAATATLTDALNAFDALGIPLWAARAAAELKRLAPNPRSANALTASERRVADLAASGLRTQELATRLFLSPKTVEAHLTNIYRKLDIRSRTQLGSRLTQIRSDERA